MLALTPVTPLAALTPYTLTIAGIADLAATPMAAPVVTTFTTAQNADLSQFMISSVKPASGATGVPTNTTIQVTFSKPIDPLTMNSVTFRLTAQGSGTPIAGTIVLSPDRLTATFTPAAALAPSTLHFVSVFSIYDLVGNAVGVNFSFTTGTQ
jgi:hypothetical protein